MKSSVRKTKIRFVDLFCGIGGFRIAAEKAASLLGVQAKCVFSSDIDEGCQEAYEANFHERPAGDISKIRLSKIPNHDLLLAEFPCQPFSIIGHRRGFQSAEEILLI